VIVRVRGDNVREWWERAPISLSSCCLSAVRRLSTDFSRSSFSSFMSWMALSRSASKLWSRRTSVNSPLPISNANSAGQLGEYTIQCHKVSVRTDVISSMGCIFCTTRLCRRRTGCFRALGFFARKIYESQRRRLLFRPLWNRISDGSKI
jgi:hypothetical protein